MATDPLKNIPLRIFRKFLLNQGCKHIRTKGGHEHWTRFDLLRPISLQTHIDPPPRIIKQVLNSLGIDKKEFQKILKTL
jgi:hypothetical protein